MRLCRGGLGRDGDALFGLHGARVEFARAAVAMPVGVLLLRGTLHWRHLCQTQMKAKRISYLEE